MPSRNPGAPRLALLYGALALLSFPTLETILAGPRGLGYKLDVFDLAGGVPRIAATVNEWSRYGVSWWDPYFGAGNDILAQHTISPLAPDVALGVVVGSFLAYAITAWLLAAVAGLGMHLFLRDVLRLPFLACLVGSIVFVFGFWHYINGFAALGLPLGLWLADRAIRPGRRRWLALAGWILFDAFLLYAGLSQIVLIAGLVQLGWLLFATPDGPRPLARFGWWTAAWAAGVALYGPVLLAQLRYLGISERTAWNLADIFDAQPLHAIANTLSFYSAVPFGVPIAAGIGGSADRYGTFFPGAVGLVLLLVAIVVAVRRPVDRRTVAVIAMLGLIPVIDLVSVLLTPVQQDLGFLRSFQLVRIRHLMPFALAAAVAIGAAAVIDETGRSRLRATVARHRLPFAVLGGGIGLLIGWQVALAILRLSRAFRRPSGLASSDVGWLMALAALVVGLVTIAIVIGVLARRRALGAGLLALTIVLFATERILFAHGERLSSGALGTYEDSIATTPGQTFILGQGPPEQNRVLSFGDAGDRMGAVGLFQADGYQAIYPLGVHDLFGALIAPQLAGDPDLYRYFWSWGVRAYAFGPKIDPEIVDLFGVRWFYVRDAPAPSGDAVERFRDGNVVVYENPDALPRAFVASAVEERATRAELVNALGRATRDELAGAAWILGEDAATFGPGLPAGAAASSRPARITAYSPDRVELSVPDGPAGVLVVTDAFGPGWTATVDDAATPVAPVDLAFRGVAVPAGPHQVVMRYEPTATYLGLAIAALAAAMTAAGALLVRRADHRGPVVAIGYSPETIR
ncbi:MAG TPA: DUF6044 family protein [Candidatus Limnocylindrales bacterium]|nr:DUF6044 family protein [Candidatus Limnocylindrales bacterium]